MGVKKMQNNVVSDSFDAQGVDIEIYKILLDNSSDPIFCFDRTGKYLYINNAFAAPFKKNPIDIIGKRIWDVFPGEEGDHRFSAVKAVFESGETKIIEVKVATPAAVIYFRTTVIPVKDVDGNVRIVICISKDITDLRQTQEALKESESRLIAAQKMALVGNWDINLATKKIWASEEAFNIYGFDFNTPYLPLERVQKSVLKEYRELLDTALERLIKYEEKYDIEFKIQNARTNEILFIHSKAVLLRDENGNPAHVIGTLQDITERKKKEEDIYLLSYRDQLTGIYNRRFYEEELKRLDKARNLPFTIVMADVNGLKLINDSFGHSVGDELLKKVALVIMRGCRADDIIARLGGDEFVILLPKTDVAHTEQVIKRIKAAAASEKVGSIDVSISFGYETKYITEENIAEVLKKAEDHMYREKLVGSQSTRSKTIKAIIAALHEKNKREEQHSHRVADISHTMGEALGLTEEKVKELKAIGLLHDIGKIAIDENLLNKTGKLTEIEWLEMKRHPEIGYRILGTVQEMSEMATYVLHHHERWDGTGYPNGLKGNKIPYISRIITIADAYDAMTSERPYRSSLPEEVVLQELKNNAGVQFDPDMIEIFIEKVLINQKVKEVSL